MFNLMDVILILVIFIAAFVGYKLGFVKAIISFFAFFIAVGLALLFYKPLAVILTEKNQIDDWIEAKIINYDQVSGDNETESISEEAVVPIVDAKEDKELTIENALSNLPDFLIDKVDFDSAKDAARHEIATKTSELIMKIMSLIIIYVLVKVTLFVASIVLGGAMKLPVLKQINEILGLSFGAIVGFMNMYVVFAIITFIGSVTDFSFVVDAIKGSLLASVMYENNIIIRLLL